MSRIKTLIAGLWLASAGAPAVSQDLHLIFAACAGRHSAEMEHAYLIGSDATRHEIHRLTFASLVEATLPLGRGPETLNHRIAAKMAQARLLTLGAFAHDPVRAQAAREASVTHIQSCGRLLLDS
ncbi:MAG: hypothetical protein AAGA47_03385 [Pseudomonadota bacterium]